MAIIAEDETRHASLAWQIAAWAEPQLTEAERRAVEGSRQRAIAALREELVQDAASEDLRTRVGLPGSEQSTRLLEGLQRTLWKQTAAEA